MENSRNIDRKKENGILMVSLSEVEKGASFSLVSEIILIISYSVNIDPLRHLLLEIEKFKNTTAYRINTKNDEKVTW